MYCPKCKQTFEEGSRRFCPTDGARLISDAAGRKRDGGIFANLIPKMEGIQDLEGSVHDSRNVTTRSGTAPDAETPEKPDDIFFELDDITPDLVDETFLETDEPARRTPVLSETGTAVRKVKPYEIPAGHVDLGSAGRSAGLAADFDEGDPEGFVGRIVKGRYKVTEFLGGDEAGLAYLADDKIVEDKKVQVRILLREESDEIMGSIIAEEHVALSHLSHPNIARLIDSGEFTNGTSFLVSEYVDALSVDDILSIHGHLDPSRAARVIRQAANGLNEAHQEGVLHRDLRPENLILSGSDGDTEQTTLVNFGGSTGEPTEQNIGYKAPEVIDGRIATVASDVFSLAVVAYEMIAGRLPFGGATAKEIVRSQYAGISEAAADGPEIPGPAHEVLKRALSFNPADRYPKARDFGDAFFSALTESSPPPVAAGTGPRVPPLPAPDMLELEGEKPPIVPPIAAADRAAVGVPQPAWKNRSPEPLKEEASGKRRAAFVGVLVLVALVAAAVWYYIVNNPPAPGTPAPGEVSVAQTGGPNDNSRSAANSEMPPLPRTIPQPPNTHFYENNKQNLKGDLLRNFVGFSLIYPKDWKVNGPQESVASNARGKFLDISRSTADDRPKEQMLISYYPSKGTFPADEGKYPEMVKETNDTLKKLLPGYQMVSEGETKINGEWRAYEVKFQAGGTSGTGEKLVVWGRRLFIPAARPERRNGFEITMIATSLADDVHSVDDVGVRGELAAILYSFEPSQNF